MRTRRHTRLRVLTVAAAAVAAAAAAPAAAFASDLVVYPGPYYSGQNPIDINACGENDIPAGYNGSYHFYYTGQTLMAYNSLGATGTAAATLNGNADQQTPFGWQSVWIQC
jgi:hypothetical protein